MRNSTVPVPVRGLLFLAVVGAGCQDASDAVGTAPSASIELSGDRVHVVGEPFTITATVSGEPTAQLEVQTMGPGLAPLDPADATQPVELSIVEKDIEIPLLCATEGPNNLVIASLANPDKETRYDSDDFEIDCIAADGESDTVGDSTSTTGSPTTSTTGDPDPTDQMDVGGGVSDDADILAITAGELLYAISLDEPPAISPGTPVEGQATRLRAEPDGDAWLVLANYAMGNDAGVLFGRYPDETLEQVPIPGAQFVSDNAFNGVEFVLTDADVGIWLFDGETVTPANTPEGALGVACDEMVCVGGAASGGFLRSVDGGFNWSVAAGTERVNAIASGLDLFVAYDDFNLEVLVSDDDGQSWSAGTFPGFQGPSMIHFADGRFVGAGFGSVYYSDDGATWMTGSTPTMGFFEVTYSPRAQQWFGASAANEFAVSPNGVDWTVLQGIETKILTNTVAGL